MTRAELRELAKLLRELAADSHCPRATCGDDACSTARAWRWANKLEAMEVMDLSEPAEAAR